MSLDVSCLNKRFQKDKVEQQRFFKHIAKKFLDKRCERQGGDWLPYLCLVRCWVDPEISLIAAVGGGLQSVGVKGIVRSPFLASDCLYISSVSLSVPILIFIAIEV